MKKLIQILAVLLSATQLFAFTPHINKGRIEGIAAYGKRAERHKQRIFRSPAIQQFSPCDGGRL